MEGSEQLPGEERALQTALVQHVMQSVIAEQAYPTPTKIEGDHLVDLPPSLREKVDARETIHPEDCDFPIPPIRDDGWLEGGWRDLPIEDCGEPLTPLLRGDGNFPKFHAVPAYFRQDLPFVEPFEPKRRIIDYSSPQLYARTSIAETLHAIASYLPAGLSLTTLDAYRDPRVQNALFEIQVQRLISQGLPEDKARVVAQKFVSKPSITPPAPHVTGAAVDVVLANHVTGDMLDFGTKFDSMEDKAALRFYEDSLDPRDATPKLNRRYLYWLMRIGNFRGWPYEWWHFDHANDPVGAHISGTKDVRFGYITTQTRTDIHQILPLFLYDPDLYNE